MIFNPEEPDKEKNDFFDGPDIPETPAEPKKPVYKPDDPQYWDEDESEWEHLRPHNRLAPVLWVLLGVIVLTGFVSVWLWWFSPYVEDGVQYGYVEKAERHGDIFKTREGVLLPYREIHDTTRVYAGDFVFSVPDREQYRELRRAQRDNRPVRVEYEVYHGALPWRGESTVVVNAVDSVDPAVLARP